MNNIPGAPNLSPAQLDMLLSMVSKKMGTTPDKLKSQLQSGDLGGNLPGNTGNLSQILNDPKQIQQILSSEKAQNLLRSLMK